MKNRNAHSKSIQQARQLLNLFRVVQLQNRFVLKAPSSDLSLLESHVLLEIDANQQINVNDLSKIINFEQSVISRVISRLEKRRYLKRRVDQFDQRKALVQLTAGGKSCLQKIDAYADPQISSSLAGLSTSGKKLVFQLYHEILKGFGRGVQPSRVKEHALRAPQREVTRVLGLLGEKAFFTDFTSFSWHLLALFACSVSSLQAGQIESFLNVKQSYLSQLLNSFVAEGWLARSDQANDKRSSSLKITDLGRGKYHQQELQASSVLAAALRQVSSDFMDEALAAYTDYCRSGIIHSNTEIPEIKIHSGDQAALRGLMVREAVRLQAEADLPQSICHAESAVYVCDHADQVGSILVQYDRQDRESVLSCSAWNKEFDYSPMLGLALSASLRAEQERGQTVSVRKMPGLSKYLDLEMLANNKGAGAVFSPIKLGETVII